MATFARVKKILTGWGLVVMIGIYSPYHYPVWGQGRGLASPSSSSVRVYFKEISKEIVKEISSAKESVWIQAYSFTSTNIARSVVLAHQRNVKVKVILDSSQRSERYTVATYLRNNGVTVTYDDAHAIAHNKVIIIDGRTVITGSYNFTKAAEERNAENIVVIHDPMIAWQYGTNFTTHLLHSSP